MNTAPMTPAGGRASLPVAYRPWRRLVVGLASFAVIGAMAAMLVATDLGILLANLAARGVARAGLDINEVVITGNRNASRLAITAAVLNGSTNSMLFADLDDIRERIEALSWVERATVSRKLPGRIEVTIAERTPVALWQRNRRFAVIDRNGQVLTEKDIAPYAGLRRLVGAGAAAHAADLFAMLDRTPDLRRQVTAAIWVGDRRWDLLFASGERLRLPEGPAAAQALERFALLNREKPLFDKGFAAFDLRLPDRLIASLPGKAEPASLTPRSAPSPAAPPVPRALAPPAVVRPVVPASDLPAAPSREIAI